MTCGLYNKTITWVIWIPNKNYDGPSIYKWIVGVGIYNYKLKRLSSLRGINIIWLSILLSAVTYDNISHDLNQLFDIEAVYSHVVRFELS